MYRVRAALIIAWGWLLCSQRAIAEAPPDFSPAQATAVRAMQDRAGEIAEINRAIWNFAEVGLEEHRSSALLQERLRAAGFDVQAGVAGMPTAFIATAGAGKPVIAILAEYDALPEMSQQVATDRLPVTEGAAGHACGHSGLGAGAFGAAVATWQAMQQHRLPGTIRLYGTPAEETMLGKVYMVLDGHFDDVDVCLHWHPWDENSAWGGSSKAVISAKFTFQGLAAHASSSPHRGRSALDGVELMNVAANYMREHIPEDSRVHYVVVNGGGQPNVVPAVASVWYYVRANAHDDVERVFAWLQEIARGAAMMSRTQVRVAIETDCHELIPNRPLTELIDRNLRRLGPPSFTDDEREFAARLQAPLQAEFQQLFPVALDESITPLNDRPITGSTDVGDISWKAPTGGLKLTCFAKGSPGHSWQNVASIGSSIGDRGCAHAGAVLAASAVELLESEPLRQAAHADWEARMQGRTYRTVIPAGQPVPRTIR